MSDKWTVSKWMHLWVAKHGLRSCEFDTWVEAMQYATDDKRDERF